MKELGEVKEEVAVLTHQVIATPFKSFVTLGFDQVSIKSEEYKTVVEEQEENLSKLAALDVEHQKSLKTILGLQAYISDLPAKEEVGSAKFSISNDLLMPGEAVGN